MASEIKQTAHRCVAYSLPRTTIPCELDSVQRPLRNGRFRFDRVDRSRLPGVLPSVARMGHGRCATPGYGLGRVLSQCVPRLALSRTLCTKSAPCGWDVACGGHGRDEQTQIDSDALHGQGSWCFHHVRASSASLRAHTERATTFRAPPGSPTVVSSSLPRTGPPLRPRCWRCCRAVRRVPGCVSTYPERGVLAPCTWRLMAADKCVPACHPML